MRPRNYARGEGRESCAGDGGVVGAALSVSRQQINFVSLQVHSRKSYEGTKVPWYIIKSYKYEGRSDL